MDPIEESSVAEPPKPRKRPKQGRSLVLVEAIQQACLRILEEEGPDRLTTQRIADVAGINIASLYQYFPNKEAVLAQVYDEVIQQATESAKTRFKEISKLSEQSLEKTLAAIIDVECQQLSDLCRLNPQFYQQYQQHYDIHGRVNELTQTLNNPSWEEWFTLFLSKHQSRLRDCDIGMLSFIARNALQGNLQAALAERPELLREEAYQQELLQVLLAYLLRDPCIQ